jgi:hypothetical protein
MRLLETGTFWLTLFLLVVIVLAKDLYIAGLERSFNFTPLQIIQEVRTSTIYLFFFTSLC